MRIFFGWTKRSDMPAIYVHLSGRDVDATLLEHHGIKCEEKIRGDTVLKPVKCPRCKLSNPAGAKFCSQCSMVLDVLEAREIDTKLKHSDEIQELYNRFMMEHAQELFKQFSEQPEIKKKIAELS
ncbi:MAG: zinc ribbon domain-containing protein [Hadesarchaea archaeon]|nr:MAG: zinc ribbon domain-containing protein [Hadesarchaea archaeon]